MKKILIPAIIAILLIGYSHLAFAQALVYDWSHSTGNLYGDVGLAITVDNAGNIYETGYFINGVDFDPGTGYSPLFSNGSRDIYIRKLDSLGNFIWAKSVGGNSFDYGRSIAVDGAGNVYISGSFENIADFDPGPGVYNLSSSGASDIFILKLDPQGNFVWVHKFGGTSFDMGLDINEDGFGNVYVTGSFRGTVDFDPGPSVNNLQGGNVESTFLLKLSSLGNFEWAVAMGSSSFDQGHSLAVDGGSSVLLTGYYSGTVDFDPGPGINNLTPNGASDLFILKLDSQGNFVWAKSLGGVNADVGEDIKLDGAGNILLVGYFGGVVDFDPGSGLVPLTANGLLDMFVLKLNSSGDFLWARSVGGNGNDLAESVAVDAFGDVTIVGSYRDTVDFDPSPASDTLVSVGEEDIFILKLDASGNYIWSGSIGDVVEDMARGVVSDAYGNIYVTGSFWGDVDFDPGLGVDTLYPSNGDEIFTMKLRLCNNSSATIQVVACNSYTVPSGDETYTVSGTYQDTIPNYEGCDSLVTIQLIIDNNSIEVVFDTACYSYVSPSGNYNWTSSGTYFDTIPSAAGCDSALVIILTIEENVGPTVSATICDGGSYTSPSGNYVWNSPGIYTDTIPSLVDCGSVVVINLTIENSSSGIISATTCGNYISPSGNYIWTSSGTYTDTISNTMGCDSIVTVHLSSIIDNSVSLVEDILIANMNGAFYQWLDCNDGLLPILGATNQSYYPTSNGSYAVAINFDGCADTSFCQTIINVGTVEPIFGSDLSLYPNPTENNVTIDLGQSHANVAIQVRNLLGQIISTHSFKSLERTVLPLGQTVGVYFIYVQTANGKSIVQKVFKN